MGSFGIEERRRAAWLAFAALLVSCSADPSMLSDGTGRDPRRGQNGTETDPAAAADGGAIRNDGGVSSNDGSAAGDGAARPDGATANAFTGAGAFIPTTGPSAQKDAHVFADNTPTTNPAKQACLDCHSPGGAGPAFAFAGTVFTDGAGTIPAVGVEVRVRATDGTAVSVYTDEDGNFYQPAPFTFSGNAGVRSATTSRLMAGAPIDGNCNSPSCHGGSHPWINLP